MLDFFRAFRRVMGVCVGVFSLAVVIFVFFCLEVRVGHFLFVVFAMERNIGKFVFFNTCFVEFTKDLF